MTQDRLTQIRQRLEAATKHPWAVYDPRRDGDKELSPCVESLTDHDADWIAQEIYRDEDAEFIAHAPEDVAYLLDLLTNAQQALKLFAIRETSSQGGLTDVTVRVNDLHRAREVYQQLMGEP